MTTSYDSLGTFESGAFVGGRIIGLRLTMADDTYTVARAAIIEAPPATVYNEIVNFHNWTHWSPWEEVDPQLRRTYSGADSGTGAVEPSRVAIDLVFEKPWKARNETVFRIEPADSGSRVVPRVPTSRRALLV